MDGVLYKWTNYLSGWQPRWFLLGGGVLSYYDSREDAWKGCKGSIQLAVCEIQVHSTDNTRMDLIIPGEQYFYLKARTAAERQKWLVALGTAKACLTDIRTQKEKGKLFSGQDASPTLLSFLKQDAISLNFHSLLPNVQLGNTNHQTKTDIICNTSIKCSATHLSMNAMAAFREFTENTEILKKRMAELRLYCDLLIQHVDKTKEMGLYGVSESENGIDMGALLKSTCTTFLNTLEECMQIASAAFSSELLHCMPAGSPHLAALKNKLKPPGIPSHTKSERQMELKNCENGSIYANSHLHEQTLMDNQTLVLKQTDEMNCEVNAEENLTGAINKDGENQLLPKEENHDCESFQPKDNSATRSTLLQLAEGEDRNFPTFFSVMSNRFSDIDLLEDGGIPTEEFLQSCYAIVPVLDKLGSTVFAPVKMDFVGNIKKINQKYITNKDEFSTLQKIVLHEVSNEVAQVRNSATEALLWLKRGLKFLKEFLTELKNGEKNIQAALNNAYGRTLRQHHGWVVRGVFALALRASPTYECFVAALSVEECSNQEELFYSGMQRDLNIYLPAMEKQLDILDALYEEHGLESDEVV